MHQKKKEEKREKIQWQIETESFLFGTLLFPSNNLNQKRSKI